MTVGRSEASIKAAADELARYVVGNWSRMTLLTWASAILDAADAASVGAESEPTSREAYLASLRTALEGSDAYD